MKRFGLKQLLIGVSLLAFLCGHFAIEACNQDRVVRRLRRKGHEVYYSSNTMYASFNSPEFGTGVDLPFETCNKLTRMESLVAIYAPDMVDTVTGVDMGERINLDSLDSGGAKKKPSDRIRIIRRDIESAAEMPFVTWLSLKGAEVEPIALSALPRMRKLKTLQLDNTSIANPDLRHVGATTSIETLTVNNTNIGDKGLRYLLKMSKLRTLCLRGTAITNAGLKHIENLPVEILDLSNTSVSDQAVESLVRFPKLLEVHLSGTAVTDVAIQQLQESRKIKIIRDSPSLSRNGRGAGY